MAVIDLILLPKQTAALAIQQIEKLQQGFKSFWINYQNSQAFPASYLNDIKLNDLFIVQNIEPSLKKILVDGVFVDDLGESVKHRELFLRELLREVKGILSSDGRLLNLNEASEPGKVKEYLVLS